MFAQNPRDIKRKLDLAPPCRLLRGLIRAVRDVLYNYNKGGKNSNTTSTSTYCCAIKQRLVVAQTRRGSAIFGKVYSFNLKKKAFLEIQITSCSKLCTTNSKHLHETSSRSSSKSAGSPLIDWQLHDQFCEPPVVWLIVVHNPDGAVGVGPGSQEIRTVSRCTSTHDVWRRERCA